MRLAMGAPLLMLLHACAVAASPLSRASSGAVFARSCGECPDTHFCEYGYDGTPTDSVACVPATARHDLYRRYAATESACTDAQALAAGATVVCATGAFFFRGCDVATGANAAVDATSSTGLCATSQLCCIPPAAFQAAFCAGKKMCVDGTAIALAVTEGVRRTCDPSTGQVDNGTGSCSGSTKGVFAGCCEAVT
ncbi:hypothetical protein DFJ74DRAFT_645557 [Hyaloraphidium curvatum]|nr:hypothetical protein DFJ74DRAFT_645557 [Hyaloraphidium curvatum]